MFGESAVLDDGRRVMAVWGGRGYFVANEFHDCAQIRFPDACLDSRARVWVSAAGQAGGMFVLMPALSLMYHMPKGPFGKRSIIRAVGDEVQVAFTTSPTTFDIYQVGASGIHFISTGNIPSGEGGQGMRDWFGGTARPLAPLDQLVNGRQVRAVTQAGTVGIGLSKFQPDQLVLSKGPALGTLAKGLFGTFTARLSTSGKYWIVVDYDKALVVGGVTPAIVPPLETEAPTPIPPPMPGKATIDSYESPISIGGTSRATMHVTQGAPTLIRWQWQEGHEWRTGAENPPTDNDHTFNRPNGRWNNIFPIGAGRFPIRIQCLDAAGNATDTSSSTSRVIEVRSTIPVPPEPTPIPPEPTPIPLPSGLLPFIATDGPIFLTIGNAPIRYRGVTAFKLCRLHANGGMAAIQPFLNAYNGFNVLRVWDYVTWTPEHNNGAQGWESCTWEQWKAFLRDVALQGWNVELGLLTDDNSARIDPARRLVQALMQAPRPTNLLLEIGNEPETHKHINTQALKGDCDASGFLYASGNYEQNAKAFGRYGCAHTSRDSEWPRKAHDLMEYYHGGGPHAPSDPARPFPWVGDEPAKMQDVASPVPPLTRMDDWRAYFAVASLLGAGATFHSESGKFGTPPTGAEAALAAAALEGLKAFPAEAPKGHYARPADKSLRTYTIDDRYMVRVRPTTSNPPTSGWIRIGTSNILWRR